LKSNIKVEGQINTDKAEPTLALRLKANPFLLEETDHVLHFTPSISGIGYAEGRIIGPLDSPEITSDFTLKQVSYDKFDYPNSQGKFLLDKKFFKFSGQFFGRQIQSDVVWPWNEKDGFSAKVQVHDLNPLFLLPLIGVPQPNSDFYSRLNAEIDLTSKNRDLVSSDGFIKINDFLLQRGSQFLKLEKPSSLIFKSGLAQMEPFSLKGDDGFLSIKLAHSSNDSFKLGINADLQLRLFHFLIPFAQSLSGNLVLDTQVLLKKDSFELFGEGELIDGLVALKGFPQPIESINTPIEFSKSKIFLSDITAQLGQSDVTGVGRIDIIGSKNIVVDIHAVADNVELNYPDKILTAGKATVAFTGNWLPYNLKVDYKVSHGFVEKDFEQDDNQATTLRASSFLPPQQAEQLTPSLTMDINIDMTKGVIVKNKLIEGEASGVLRILGTPENPNILGQIDIRQGSKLIFKDKAFDIQTATIQFKPSKEINPDIYISANSRVSDYDINLLVQGTAKKLSIKPTSQPPLPEPDIFSLLALGVTSQNDQNLSSDTQQKQTGLEVLAAISNQSQLNKKIQEKLGLTLQLAPSVDSTKNIAVPKVVVSKKISNKLNASYSKPFTGNDQNQEIKLQYLYNNNVSLQLNYQNKDTVSQDQVANPGNNSKSILGLDLEFRDEFK
jgi:translocation and assembly module TamB